MGWNMTISEKIFKRLEQINISQKEFAEKTGISQSAISDWKRKKTNPTADKILIISEALGITPNDLLSGTDIETTRSNPSDFLVVDKNTELGEFLIEFQSMNDNQKNKIMGYVSALKEIQKDDRHH